MNTKRFLLGITAVTLTLGFVQAPASAADQTTVQEVTQTGPAQVVDSWMEPKIVRTKEIKDADGNTTVVNEPLIQERHEKVVVPTNKTTLTTTVHQEPAVVKTVEKHYVSAAPAKKVYKKKAVRKARRVAYKPKPKRYVAAQEVVRKEIAPAETTVIQRTDNQSSQEVIVRPDPALEMMH